MTESDVVLASEKLSFKRTYRHTLENVRYYKNINGQVTVMCSRFENHGHTVFYLFSAKLSEVIVSSFQMKKTGIRGERLPQGHKIWWLKKAKSSTQVFFFQNLSVEGIFHASGLYWEILALK